MRRLMTILLLVMGLAGCGREPPADQVRQDLLTRLSSAFGPGLFNIMSLSRRGSSTDINSLAGEERQIVYYDATLQLSRDVNFGGWDTPGVATIVTAFGAGPKGIRGAKADGNKAGDVILAHGTAVYRKDGDNWRGVAPTGFAAPVAPALDRMSPPGTSDLLLTALQDVVRNVPTGAAPAAQAVINQELSRAVSTIQARLTRLSKGYPVAAGQDGGQYVRFVQALQVTKPMGLTFRALLTEGSVENLGLLRQGDVVVALAQGDIAAQAMAGQGPFAAQGPFDALRAIGSLYPEPLHILVRADSPAKGIGDLTRKRIGLGPRGSGTRATAERLLAAYGMSAGKDYDLDETPFAPALAALQSGKLDAVMQIVGMPADQIRNAAASIPLRLLPVDDAVLSSLTAKDAALLRGSIPRGTYQGVDADVPTLTVAALVVTTSALGEAEGRTLATAIFGNKADLLAAGSAQGGQVSARTARLGVPIPLPKGAEAALIELGSKNESRANP